MNNSNWETEIIKVIQQLSHDLSESDKKKYKIKLLERLVRRIEEFSNDDCFECEKYKGNINTMIDQINTSHIKEYKRNFDFLLKHMKEKYLLYTENEKQNELMSLGISFGLVIGTGLGLVFGTLGIPIGRGMGMVIGMSLGMSIGANMDKKNSDEGRII